MLHGKSAIVPFLIVLGIIASLFGSQLLYKGEYEDVEYSIYLKKFTVNGDTLKSTIKVKITNNKDTQISATNIDVKLYDPEAENPFFETTNIGGMVLPGESETFEISVECNYDDIPEHEVRITLTALVDWEFFDGEWINIDIVLPIEVEI